MRLGEFFFINSKLFNSRLPKIKITEANIKTAIIANWYLSVITESLKPPFNI